MRKGNRFNKTLVLFLCLVIGARFIGAGNVVSAANFGIGDTVRVTTNLNVRTGPGTSYPEITDPDYPGYAPEGTIGEVLSGPSSADGYIWWEVDYGPGLYSGWSVGDGLIKVLPVNGIDVSHWQGDVDWSQVYNAGYRFAFAKASGATGFIDDHFEINMIEGHNAGMLMGAFHFAYPEYNDPVDEADFFVSVAGEYLREDYLRPVLDLEDDENENSYPFRLGNEALSNWVHDWMNTVESKTGIEPILYVNSNYANNYLDSSITQYDLWIAHWRCDTGTPPDTGIWDSWDFWQYYAPEYCGENSVPGINGSVDLDSFNGDMDRLYTFTITAGETAPTITSSLSILESPPYYVGDTITAQFTIKNKGTAPITFEVLTVGGRDPDDQVADFTFRNDIILNPDEFYNYEGTLELTKVGDYHFFTAYKTPDGNWNTAIPTESGVTNVLDITVSLPPNTPPELSDGYVEPAGGDISTDFYYYVTYFDPDGDEPSVKQVYIDGTAYTMSWHSGLDSWITYRYGPKNLPAGSHTYYFYFEDGRGGTARLPTSGSYSGPTVSPTVNNPPNTPSNPSPSNHATRVSIAADLSWSGGDPDAGDTVTYDVYFGISASPPLVSNDQLATTYDPGTLSYNTTYYWKIIAADNHGASAEGPIWDFTTQAKIIYIKADGSVDPPTAPILNVGNVYYTFTADIHDSIVVQRDNIVVDGAGYTIQGLGGGKGINLAYRSNVTTKNMEIKAFHSGVYLVFSSNNSISGNNITNNTYGIELGYSNYNSISGNQITNNEYGIVFWHSNYNSISGNNITANNWPSIWLYESSNNSVSENNITNNLIGIRLSDSSSYNSIYGNNITANNLDGILFRHSNYNSISGNQITNNECGIWAYESLNNVIYHNNFINNTRQAYVEALGYANVWDDGYPSGGNYWSDHTDVDLYRGPHQNVTGSDGIGDTPYIIDEDNQDNYPLMSPYEYWSNPILGDINKDMKVDYEDLFQLTIAYGSTSAKPNWNPNCDFNRDNKVDVYDLFDLSKNYGKTNLEIPFGTFVASTSMIVALVAYVAVPGWRRKWKYVNL